MAETLVFYTCGIKIELENLSNNLSRKIYKL